MPLTPGAELTVRLFPLSGVVLFPGLPLPLHVFEPRYRALTRDALEGDRRIAVVLLRPGWEEDYGGRPPVHDVGGLGMIEKSIPHDDGRFDLLLRGEARFRILSEEPGGEFRRAKAVVLEDRETAADAPQGAEAAARMREDLRVLLGEVRSGALPEGIPVGALAGAAASLARLSADERQTLLHERDGLSRARALIERLAPRVQRLRALDRALRQGWNACWEEN